MSARMPADSGLPRLALTMGDVSGIGPEIIVRACCDVRTQSWCRPVIFGHPDVLSRAVELLGVSLPFSTSAQVDPARVDEGELLCVNTTEADVARVPPGAVDPRSGQAAGDWLRSAARAAMAGLVDGIVTAPLNKEALALAGHSVPGHTELLQEVCGSAGVAMMLYLPTGTTVASPHGLGVAHVTLHTSVASVPGLLSTPRIRETIELIDGFMRRVGCVAPRIGVCALNPHAGEHGLFGDEEARLIAPAVEQTRQAGVNAAGPIPADALLRRAVAGEFDGVAAMYHDQGHIALKLIGFDRAVNVTLGLPIVRTSPSHGTAFDIAWQGKVQSEGMMEAIRVAALLARRR